MANSILLSGCRPEPLMSYLKALGVFRLVAEQADENATLAWQAGHLVLETELDRAGLLDFFLTQYRPSSILAPWNGGSGFHPKSNKDKAYLALETWRKAEQPRFAQLKTLIGKLLELNEKSNFTYYIELQRKNNNSRNASLLKAQKGLFVARIRNEAPDCYLDWIDAVAVITGDHNLDFPPLFGTGANDGNFDFSTNFLQRLRALFSPHSGLPLPEAPVALMQSLFETPAPILSRSAPVGQFGPGSAGGANNVSGFDGDSAVNPWDYVLMLEGALLFASACSRRFDRQAAHQRAMAYPFCVRATGAGYLADSQAEAKQGRDELWVPTWSDQMGLDQLRLLLQEGRVQVDGRAAKSGLDFAMALGSLGVDRGLETFHRYSFLMRNGRSFFAVPSGRFPVQRNPQISLLTHLHGLLDQLDRAAKNEKPPPPNSFPPVVQQLQRAIFRQTQEPGEGSRLRDVLLALGDTERQMNRSLPWARETARLRSINELEFRWFKESNPETPEFRLAASLAASYLVTRRKEMNHYRPFRQFMEQVEPQPGKAPYRVQWLGHPGNDAVWAGASVTDSMIRVLTRLLMLQNQEACTQWSLLSNQHARLDGIRVHARLDDIRVFLSGDFDDAYFERCLWGLVLIGWKPPTATSVPEAPADKHSPDFPQQETSRKNSPRGRVIPSAFYALLKLCFAGGPVGGEKVPLKPAIAHLAAAGHGDRASEAAIIRLRGCGLPPIVPSLRLPSPEAKRAAAALLFPLGNDDLDALGQAVLPVWQTPPLAEPTSSP